MIALRPAAVSAALVVLVLFAGAAGCASAPVGSSPPAAPAADPDLARLASFMTGSFSSAAQAAARPDDFFDIRLEMVPIWAGRGDGAWLYVEQASASSLDKPYRQRVYRLRRVGGDLFESQVYELPDPARFAGAWREPARFDELQADALVPRGGCAIVLRALPDGTFAGSTLGRLCTSQLRGATFATSEAVLGPEGLVTLDRGWNDAGEQVWGSTAGGYRFERVPAAGGSAEK